MISVVIPTKNRPDLLERCLMAVSKQATVDEAIVVDDSSHTAAKASIKAIVKRAHLATRLLENKDTGAASARNTGAAQATGSIIAFLDDDAEPLNGWAEAIVQCFQDTPGLAAVTGRVVPADAHRPRSCARQLRYESRRKAALSSDTAYVDFLAGGNSAVSRAAFELEGGFDPRFVYMHDSELALRLVEGGRLCVYADNMVVRHLNDKGCRTFYLTAILTGK